MKIVQIIYSLCAGGAEKFVVNLSNELASRGHDVTLLQLLAESTGTNTSFNRQFLSDNVHYLNAGLTSGFSLSKVKKISRIVKDIHPDIVNGHLNVMPYVIPLVCGNNQIRFYHTLHSVAQSASGLRIQKCLNRWLYRSGQITPVTISKLCETSYRDFYNLTNSVLIENGTSPVKPSADFRTVQSEIECLKQSISTKVFIHLGRFHPAKNQRLLIDSFNRFRASGHDAILLILGSGFDSPEASDLKKTACSSIHFLGVKKNVGDYLLCSDVFCLSSIYEGLPISLLEAMSVGILPVCTAVGGIPDVVKEGITGYLSSELTQECYVATLERAVAVPLPPEVIKSTFEHTYSIAKCADAYISLYQKS